ncbi:MAG: hypothetical protein PHF84_06585 [bacterium]|nr:hypothetical protein [bacterium]
MNNKIKFNIIDEPVRDAIIHLHKKNISTNSSEGGGGGRHGTPHFAYIEAKLSRENIRICMEKNFLLKEIYGHNGPSQPLYNGSAFLYGKQTGYYVIGLNRKKLSDRKVKEYFKTLIRHLSIQNN